MKPHAGIQTTESYVLESGMDFEAYIVLNLVL